MCCVDPRYAFNANGTGRHETWLLTEAGLYRFLLASLNKLGMVFLDWVCFEVIPSIRRSGGYAVNEEDKAQLVASNKALHKRLRAIERRHEEAKGKLKEEVDRLKEVVQLGAADVQRQEEHTLVLMETLDMLKVDDKNDKEWAAAVAELEEERDHSVALFRRSDAQWAADKNSLDAAQDDLVDLGMRAFHQFSDY